MLALAKKSGIVDEVKQTFISSILSDHSPENWQRCAVALALVDTTINLLESIADGNGTDTDS
jgi:hypothetical protein